MRKKIFAFCLALALSLLAPVCARAAENLAVNGGFDAVDASGLPEGWSYAAWTQDESVSTYWMEEVDGNPCVRLQNFSANDARLEQQVAVRGNTIYRIRARMKAEGGDPTHMGANLSVSDTLAVSGDWTDTGGDWVEAELYGKTGLFQSEITVALRVGFYGEENVGSAWFDDVIVEPVDEVPAGFAVQNLKDAPVSSADQTEGADWVPMQTFVAVLYAALLLAAMWRLRGVELPARARRIALIAVLCAAGAVRLLLAATHPGYEVDVGCFTSWGQTLCDVGPASFYAQGFCDYPPGYLYVLGAQAWIANAVGLVPGEAAYLLLLKLPAVACDLAAAYLVYRIGCRCIRPTWALLAGAAYALLPVTILDSAMWGQMDGVLVLLTLLVADAFLNGRTLRAAVWYGVAVMVKPQALMLGVIMLTGYVLEIMDHPREGFKKLLLGVAACAAVMAAIALPFLVRQPATYILEKYFSTLSSYPYATVNALNLFYILGGNWVTQETRLLGLSYAAWGAMGMALSVGASLFFCFKSREKRAIPLTAALMLAGVFCLGVRMHERYMFPALLLLLLSAVLYGDRRLWQVFAGYGATNAVNLYIVLQNQHVLEENRALGIVVAAVNLMLLVYLVEICVDLCLKKRTVPMDPERVAPLGRQVLGARLPDAQRGGDCASLRMGRIDYLLMAALTLVYACFAFYQLGDTAAPATLWRASEGDEAVIDLGATQTVTELRYYGEIPYGDFTVEWSEDGRLWSQPVEQSVGVHDMFKWHSVALEETAARYVRLRVTNQEIALFEAGLFGPDGEQLTIASCTAPKLADEQSLVPAEISYMNGMYFDEVYHGRTAYEQLHGMEWYENTHPPLGKVFISWSIAAFGMTPFGWRFAGTLAGVLMVPAMYFLCKALFRKPLFAFLGTFLMTFDFMHLAQTRLGTIDSYPVLFIILGFAFMLRYAYRSFYHDPFWKTLVPLFWSGLFMGLGMASKWIGVYAAAGLAVLFFCIFGARTREYLDARRDLNGGAELSAERRAQCEKLTEVYPRRALGTIAACVLFFVVIPLGIYVASYYQFLRIDAPNHGLKEVWDYQLHMFNYHKGVFDSHPFESPWWQWPLDIRNIWYYVSDSMPEGWVSSISALGNPAVWWTGLACLVWTAVRAVKGYAGRDPRLWWVLIGFAANYLPWVLVPRVTFVYHYFASVPFIILATVLFFEDLYDKKRWARGAIYAFMGVVLALFLLFYPALTGVPMTQAHAALLNWLPSWVLY